MKDITEIREFLRNSWFSDRIELRKAREMLARRFPDDTDFMLRFYSAGGVQLKNVITAEDLRNFITDKT